MRDCVLTYHKRKRGPEEETRVAVGWPVVAVIALAIAAMLVYSGLISGDQLAEIVGKVMAR